MKQWIYTPEQTKTHHFLQGEVLFQKRLPNNEFMTRTYDDGHIIASQVPENRTQIHYIVNGGLDSILINEMSEDRQGRDVTSILGTEHISTLMADYVKPLMGSVRRLKGTVSPRSMRIIMKPR